MKKFSILLLITTTLVFSGCKNDLEVLAPYKETCIVYGLLNAADSTQYIRINRAFLGEQDASIMAQHPDSFNYPNILDVTLERWKNGSKLDSYSLERDSSINLEPGIFANTPNILYKTPQGKTIFSDSDYRLSIYNRVLGITTTSETMVLGKVNVLKPLVIPGNAIIIGLYNVPPYNVRFATDPEAAGYNLTVKFNYAEAPVNNPTALVSKTLELQLPNEPNSGVGSSAKEYLLLPEDLFGLAASQIPVDNNLNRTFKSLTFVFTAAAQEFYTYSEVNQPPTGLVQSIPDYTNIINGKGIFSSRYTTVIPNVYLDNTTMDSLRNGSITQPLRFQ